MPLSLITLLVFVLVILGVGATLGRMMLRAGRGQGLLLVLAGHVLAAIGLVLMIRQIGGLDSAGLQLLLFFMVVPSFAGFSLGGVIGLLRR